MNLQIPLSPETEAKLRKQALAAGKDLDTFVLEVVKRTLQATAFSDTPAYATITSDDPLLGLLADTPELADQITESAMHNREARPLRTMRE